MRFSAVTGVFLCGVAVAEPAPEPLHALPFSTDRAGFRLAAAFDCSNRSCKALRSCEEACYKLIVCGQKVRDGDNDGIPCENLCSAPCR
ncbi:MAG: excalibur calcium-binding domain-containing protein [Tropicimonas sp.]|uniref:excalibur calcium-binding domain-containing protein n=1 Tax=Tropicimonas sp. TaxID=2067044 RepID=UPI003A8374DF